MIDMAAGMTIGGKIPFTGTFANFTGRVYDQIRQSVAYSEKSARSVHRMLDLLLVKTE